MSRCPDFDYLLVLPRLHVHNANAASSPLTHGFPSMTAFTGLMWALQRKAQQAGLDVSLQAVGVVCHNHDEQVSTGGYMQSFRLTRNPIGKDGKTAAIVEEGRIHLDVSLIFAVRSVRWDRDPDSREADAQTLTGLLHTMRIAGGSIQTPLQPARQQPRVVDLGGSQADQANLFRRLRLQLLPGFTLVERPDRLDERMQALKQDDDAASPLDAWLSLARTNWRYEVGDERSDEDHKSDTPGKPDKSNQGEWTHDRRGWLVPIPIGYGGLGELHEASSVANARDPNIPFRFVESLYSVGQWLSPHRLQSPRQMLWYPDSEPDIGLYRCRNDYVASDDAAEPQTIFEFDYD